MLAKQPVHLRFAEISRLDRLRHRPWLGSRRAAGTLTNDPHGATSLGRRAGEDLKIRLKQLTVLSTLVAAAFSSSSASAASMAANVSTFFQLSGKIYVFMTSVQWDGAQTTCTPTTPSYLIDPNTAVGRAQFALLLTAKEAGHRVYLVGDGTCVGGGPNGVLAESLIGVQLQ